MQRYKITCLNCHKDDIISVQEVSGEQKVFFEKMALTPFLAARWRPDARLGFECSCGNYDLLADEEKKDFDKLVSGSGMRLKEIAKMLASKTKLRFKQEAV